MFGILNAFLQKYILKNPGQTIKDFQARPAMQLTNGIALKQEDYGISAMLNNVKRGRNGKENQENVFIVKKNSKRLLEKMDACINSAIQTAKPLIIENVRFLSEKADVWCINVPDLKHFSLSNGAIVHNCDAFRYMCISLPKTADGLSAEELEKRYYQTIYGSESHLPAALKTDDELWR